VWGGDLHLSLKGKPSERLEEEIHNADLARLDALIIPGLRKGQPLFDSRTCRNRGRLGAYPWRGGWFRKRRRAPFEQAAEMAGEKGLRVWAQMDVLVGGTADSTASTLARARPRLTIRNARSRPNPIGDDSEHWFLCPSNPDVVRLLSEVAVELANEYPLSALVLDVRAFPHENPEPVTANCLCFQCQDQVERDLGLDLQEVLDEGTPEIWDEWQAWRTQKWLDLIRRIRTQVWTVRPGLPVFVRAAADRATPGETEEPPPRRFGPAWMDWVRAGLAEILLLDQCHGTQSEAERTLLDGLPSEDMDSLILPLFHETPAAGRPENWARLLGASLPGWGLTQHLAEAWSTAIVLRPGPRHGEACTLPALEIDPLAACVEALRTAEKVLHEAPLVADLRSVREALVGQTRRLELETLEGLIFQLATLVTMLDQERESDRDEDSVPRGWVELARRLLRWHANLHCNELYLFDTG